MAKSKDTGIRHFVEQLSQKPELQSYLNNLDEVLGIKTRDTCYLAGGIITFQPCGSAICAGCKCNSTITKELAFINNELIINSHNFDWYIVAKKDNREYFRIIGVNKKDEAKGVVYELGETKDINNIETILKKDEDGWKLLLLNYNLSKGGK